MSNTITLYGELYSKKNSRRVFSLGRKITVLPSKKYMDTKPAFMFQLKDTGNKAKWAQIIKENNFPIHLNIKIYRKTKREFDYNNIVQGLQDMLVEAGWVDDDSAKYLVPYFEEYEVDKKNPRVVLSARTTSKKLLFAYMDANNKDTLTKQEIAQILID